MMMLQQMGKLGLQMDSKTKQFLSFVLNNQSYGVQISSVREINRMSEITTVPKTSNFVEGVMNLRGKVVPVINLRLKLGFEKKETTKATCIVVVDTEFGQVGMIVDSIEGVLDLSSDQIENIPDLGGLSKDKFVLGVGKVETKVIVLLDILKLLSHDDVVVIAA